jgi:adenosylcobinamide-GDP ribazoletransferase
MRALVDDLLAAIQLLTRLPVGWIRTPEGPPDLARVAWAYPLVGAAVGAVGGLVYAIAAGIGCPPALAAIWSLAALVLVTGAFHEDGLADMADGLGGATRERKLEIMRDSRTGSYGVIALLLSLGLRGTAIALLADSGAVVTALIIAGALGRGAIIALLLLLDPARSDGLAAQGGRPHPQAATAGLAFALLTTIVLAPAGAAFAALVAAGIGGGLVYAVARRQLGGHTGDVLGAGAQVAECLVLTALVVTA